MSKSLRKILRLREIDEEVCRLKLASECERLSEIEAVLTAFQMEKQDARSIIFCEISNDLLEERVVAEGVSRISQLRIAKLKDWLIEQQARVAIQREQYVESKISRTQLARLLSDKQQELEADELRRQQSALDDWFNHSKCQAYDARSRGLEGK